MKISIITASYNYEQYIEEAIKSVINQTYTDWELIIVDDGSIDNSVEIIKKYCQKDKRIKFFQHDNSKNKGLTKTLEFAVSKASGDWIAFLEADDTFEPLNLEKKVKAINKHPEVALVFNKVNLIWEDEKRRKKHEKLFLKHQKRLSNMKFPKNMFEDLFIYNLILTFSCTMINVKKIDATWFKTPQDRCIDWWIWIHMAFKNDFYYIDESLTNWRLHSESYTNKNSSQKWFILPINAYEDVYKHNKSFNLLLFIVKQKIKLYLIKFFMVLKSII